jgi:DNA-directed RNA polymerase
MLTLRERQEQLELEQVRLGALQYTGERLPWQAHGAPVKEESASEPGKALVRQYIAPLATAIEIFMQACADGEAGRKHAAYPYLLHVLPEQAAYLALRVTINSAASRKKLATAAEAVAIAIEDHINFETMAGQNPGLYKITLQHLLRYREPRRRREVMSRQLKKYALDKLTWTVEERVLLGSKLIELVEVVTGLVRVVKHTEGRHLTRSRVEFAPEAEEWIAQAHDKMALLCPVHLPMLVQPRPWTSPTEGGYLTNAIRAWLVRVKKREQLGDYEGIEMPQVYDAVNRIQNTAWRINRSVWDVMRQAWAAGDTLGGLPTAAATPAPAKPSWLIEGMTQDQMSVDQVEDFRVWCAKAAKAHEDEARRVADRITLARKLHIASMFADEEEFYFPHYVDFRSRVYPFCDALSPQGDDATKGLLEFAGGKPLGEAGGYWLAVHLANCFALDSIDKASLDARVQWVRDHEAEILDSAMNPLDGQRFWTQAESPWCALAACFEWAGFLVQGDDYVSHLPVNMDGSCSGLQHYSAMLRDPLGGAAVNLVPGEKPADIYSAVASRAQAIVDASEDASVAMWKGGKVIRKIAKQPTMTMCYSATKFGMRQQIENALRKLDEDHGGVYLEGADNFKSAVAMADIVWEAIGDVVVAARAGMDFLKACAKIATEAGLPVRWTTPSGFVVSQAYGEDVGEQIEVHYNGQRLRVNIVKDGEALSTRRQGAGIAPNFVHSLDSSHLMATINAGAECGIVSWSVIHDSFGCHAADVGLLNELIRETFVTQYSPDVLARFREELRAAVASVNPKLADKLPPVPPMGNLDLDAVKRSDFFFA